MSSRINILNIPIDKTTLEEVVTSVRTNLKNNIRTFIATPNPEMILASLKDPAFQKVLNSTDINIADGIGILWAATYLEKVKTTKSKLHKILIAAVYLPSIVLAPSKLRKVLPERVTGADLLKTLCKSNIPDTTYFLLGGQSHVTQKTADIIKTKYKLPVIDTDSSISSIHTDKELIDKINNSGANVLFVAYGAPKQEMWLYRNLPHLTHVKLAIGIGGAFDFMSGEIQRAPQIMRFLGLEWLFRLIRQPSRIKRIYNAAIKFPLKVISSSF